MDGHRCRVHKPADEWLVTCPVCRETQRATNWYLAMGAARFHRFETSAPARGASR